MTLSPYTGCADIHIHTTFSDGEASPAEVLAYVAKHTDLTTIAITDHDRIEGAFEAADLVTKHNYPFDVIVGEEITTKHGDVIGLYLTQRIPPGLSFEETLYEIQRQGGLAIIPHPNLIFFHVHPARVQEILHSSPYLISGIELSSFILFNTVDAKRWENICKIHHLAAIGGSDSHQMLTIGKAQTRFMGKTAEDFRIALQTAKTEPYFMHLTSFEKIQFFSYAIKKKVIQLIQRQSKLHKVQKAKTSPIMLALRTAKHYLHIPY